MLEMRARGICRCRRHSVPSIFTAFLEALRFTGARGPMLWLDLRGGEQVGAIGLGLPGREAVIRCAPRDVVVLAVVARVPVYIGDALARAIGTAQPDGAGCRPRCEESVAEWLDRVQPEDFR